MSGSADKLAMVALSHVVQTRRSELMTLRKELDMVANKQQSSSKRYLITRKELDDGLREINVEETDHEVFDRLFTLFDKTGAGKVHFLELVVGLAPVLNASLSDRVRLAFELTDEDGRGFVDKREMKFLFKALNSTANFLGDPMLTIEEIEELVESLFTSVLDAGSMTEAFPYPDNIEMVTEHPIIDSWLRRAGIETGEAEGENKD